jgi:site-specific DNA recombinase
MPAAICAARGWQVVGVYSDNSISAADARKVRPGYNAMHRDYEAGLFDAVVVDDLDPG